ncbi:MAG TPA: hypothetical protein VGR67_11300 [Candidatus Polarisedimenticolia bacterium]|nr:hypothetical protein [Candidatus Polarisedimenticolia bacterium]
MTKRRVPGRMRRGIALVLGSWLAAATLGLGAQRDSRAFAGGRAVSREARKGTGPPRVEMPRGTSGRMDLVIHPPRGATIRRYAVELSAWDAASRRWREPSPQARRTLSGPEGKESLDAGWFSAAAPGSVRWRLRARCADPPGPWSDWLEFQPGFRGDRVIRRLAPPAGRSPVVPNRAAPPSTGSEGRVPAFRPAAEGREQSAPLSRPPRRPPPFVKRGTGGSAGAGSGAGPVALAAPRIEAWSWNVLTQEGSWTDHLSVDEAGVLQLRWKPASSGAGSALWELRAGNPSAGFQTAPLLCQASIEPPASGQEWRTFQIDLGAYPVKGAPRRYVAVRQAPYPVSSPVEIRFGEPDRAAAPQGVVKVAGIDTAARVIQGPLSAKFEAGKYVTVSFAYKLLKPAGGRIFPALLDENGKISPRNYWEASGTLEGLQGIAQSRMTLTCPKSSAGVVRVPAVLYTVTNPAGDKIFNGVAKLPRTLLFTCPSSPVRTDRNEIAVAAPPKPAAGKLTVAMSFHASPDCNCDYGRFNLEYPIYRSVKAGETMRLFSYLLREGGKPILEKNQCGTVVPESNGLGFEWVGGKLGGTVYSGHYDAVFCRDAAAAPGWGPSYRITGIRVELRRHNGWGMCQSPESMDLVASDTFPVDLMVVCQ